MSRLIDADALIEFCAERWIPLNIDAVNMQPTIQPQSTTGQLNDGAQSTARSTDLIDRQAAIDLVTDMEFMNFTAKGILRDSLRKLSPAQPELNLENLVRMIEFGITATNSNDAYSLGMRNGMRWCKSLIDGVEPKFEEMSVDNGKDLPSIQPEPQWIPVSERLPETEEFVLASLTGKYRNITFEHACEIADYADGEWCVYAYPHMSAEKCEELIEAWMPLPEPYKPNNK